MCKFLRLVGFGWPWRPIMRWGQRNPYKAFTLWTVSLVGNVIYFRWLMKQIEKQSQRPEIMIPELRFGKNGQLRLTERPANVVLKPSSN